MSPEHTIYVIADSGGTTSNLPIRTTTSRYEIAELRQRGASATPRCGTTRPLASVFLMRSEIFLWGIRHDCLN